MKYKLSGTYRLQKSIGNMETFTSQVKAPNPMAAMDADRQAKYEAGYDHILYKAVEVKARGQWRVIPMLKALGLE